MHKRNSVQKYAFTAGSKIGFLLLVILIAGCAKATPPTPTAEVPPSPSESSAPTAIDEITPTQPISEVQTSEAADSNCIACHVDKDQLINTADPVEEKESDSSGEG
jgi:hypothetical protein